MKLFLNMKILNHTLQSYNEVKVRDREFNVVLPYEFFKMLDNENAKFTTTVFEGMRK